MAFPCATTVASHRRWQHDLIRSFVCFSETVPHISVSRAPEAFASSAERMEAEASSVGTSKLEWQHGDSDALCGQASSGLITSNCGRRRKRYAVIESDSKAEYKGREAIDQLDFGRHLRRMVRAGGASAFRTINLSVVPRDVGLVDGFDFQPKAQGHRRHRNSRVCDCTFRGQVPTWNGGESAVPLRVYAGEAPSQLALFVEPMWPAIEAKQASASIDLLRALCLRARGGLREGVSILDRGSQKARFALRRPAPQVQAIQVLVGRSMAVVGGADVLHGIPRQHREQPGMVVHQGHQRRADIRRACQGRQQNQTRRDQSDTPAARKDAGVNTARQVAVRVAMASSPQGPLDFAPTIAAACRNSTAPRAWHSRLATYARHAACVAWCRGRGQGCPSGARSQGQASDRGALRQHRIGTRSRVAESVLGVFTIQLPVRIVFALRRAPGRVRYAVGVFHLWRSSSVVRAPDLF